MVFTGLPDVPFSSFRPKKLFCIHTDCCSTVVVTLTVMVPSVLLPVNVVSSVQLINFGLFYSCLDCVKTGLGTNLLMYVVATWEHLGWLEHMVPHGLQRWP
jgi:hypothetical protein